MTQQIGPILLATDLSARGDRALDRALQFAEQHASNSTTGQADMFGLASARAASPDDADGEGHPPFIMAADWTEQERLTGEKETLGFYLEGHPISRYEAELAGIISVKLQNLRPGGQGGSMRLIGRM